MSIFDRFVLSYVSFLPVLFSWLIKKKVSPFFIEIVCSVLFSKFFCRLKYKILLRYGAIT